MKAHSTNYHNTLIVIADDCPAKTGEVPPLKSDKRSVANMQFDILAEHPYKYTSDDVLFRVYAEKNQLPASAFEEARAQFFSKGQPCMRCSPLTKRYGWGIHSDKKGRIAIYPCNSAEYHRLEKDSTIAVVKAMKTSRA